MNLLKYGAMQGNGQGASLGETLYNLEEVNLVYLTDLIEEDGDLCLRGDPVSRSNQWV